MGYNFFSSDLVRQCGEGNSQKFFAQNMSTTVPWSSWLAGKTLIESVVAKQAKNVRFCFFQNILQVKIFYNRQRDI